MQRYFLCCFAFCLVRQNASFLAPSRTVQSLRAPFLTELSIKRTSTRPTFPLSKWERHDTAVSLGLEQYASDAISLFNNMRAPAAVLAGAIVPMGFGQPLPPPPDGKKEGEVARFVRQAYMLVVIISLSSDLLSVMWSTVAVNQLSETVVAPASSVWHLLSRDFALPWAGTNAHFTLALLGFMWMVATRGYLAYTSNGFNVGRAGAGFATSGFLLMLAIVNRGLSIGRVDKMKSGAPVLALFCRYVKLLVKRASAVGSFGALEVFAVAISSVSAVLGIRGVAFDRSKKD